MEAWLSSYMLEPADCRVFGRIIDLWNLFLPFLEQLMQNIGTPLDFRLFVGVRE